VRTLLFSLLLTLSACAKPLQLDFEVERTRKPLEGAAETTTFPLQVLLGDGVLHYRDGGGDTLLDFQALRTYNWTDQAWDEVSLYAIAGGRMRQLDNRAKIGEALVKATKAQPAFAEVALEHVFAMNIPGGKEAPELAAAPALKATFGDKLLAEASADGQAVEPDVARAYTRFVRYYVAAHPDFLSRLEASKTVPSSLTVVQYGPREERRYHLKFKASSTETTLSATPPAQGMVPRARQLDRLLHRVRSITTAQTAQRNQALLQRAEADRKAKKYLPSVLRYFDYYLSTGRELPAPFTKHKATYLKAPDAKALFGALDKSSSQPKPALAALQALEKKAGEMAYVCQIFRAGILLDSDTPKAGLELYLQALEKQPLVTGAWKDVGDIFYRAYLAEEAWKCWDAALRLQRNHAMLSDVKELEAMLRQDYPEFF
jgi:hypothetical protein